jgi:hypothetical protein
LCYQRKNKVDPADAMQSSKQSKAPISIEIGAFNYLVKTKLFPLDKLASN